MRAVPKITHLQENKKTSKLLGTNVANSLCCELPDAINLYRRKRPKVDANIFDSALSHTRRSDKSKKREENSAFTFGRFRLWTSLEFSPVSVKDFLKDQKK